MDKDLVTAVASLMAALTGLVAITWSILGERRRQRERQADRLLDARVAAIAAFLAADVAFIRDPRSEANWAAMSQTFQALYVVAPAISRRAKDLLDGAKFLGQQIDSDMRDDAAATHLSLRAVFVLEAQKYVAGTHDS